MIAEGGQLCTCQKQGGSLFTIKDPRKDQMKAFLTSHIGSVVTLKGKYYRITGIGHEEDIPQRFGPREPIEKMEFTIELANNHQIAQITP